MKGLMLTLACAALLGAGTIAVACGGGDDDTTSATPTKEGTTSPEVTASAGTRTPAGTQTETTPMPDTTSQPPAGTTPEQDTQSDSPGEGTPGARETEEFDGPPEEALALAREACGMWATWAPEAGAEALEPIVSKAREAKESSNVSDRVLERLARDLDDLLEAIEEDEGPDVIRRASDAVDGSCGQVN